MTNLLTNVERYAYPPGVGGRVDISLAVEPQSSEPRYLIRVRDYGAGIPAEHLARVFDPFFTTGRGRGGTGLGLAIVYNLVTVALKGAIAIESTPGEGTEVRITLPRTVRD
jgi:signal transduction histidine kinase